MCPTAFQASTLPPAFRDAVVALGSRAVLAAPLNVKGRIIGVLVISYTHPRDFADRVVALLQAFADQAALALKKDVISPSRRNTRLIRLSPTVRFRTSTVFSHVSWPSKHERKIA